MLALNAIVAFGAVFYGLHCREIELLVGNDVIWLECWLDAILMFSNLFLGDRYMYLVLGGTYPGRSHGFGERGEQSSRALG